MVSLFKKFFPLLCFLFGGIEHIHHASIRVFLYAILRRAKARIGSRREQYVVPNTEDVQNRFFPFIEATDEIFEVCIVVGLVIDAGDRALWLEKFIRPKCPTCLIGNNINGCEKRLSEKTMLTAMQAPAMAPGVVRVNPSFETMVSDFAS